MYEYLAGSGILFVFFVLGVIVRPDLRKPMIWSGVAYVALNTIGFVGMKILSMFVYLGPPVVPGYWNPNTLFDLGRITGGYAIEDALFMFFLGAIATFVYEYLFRKKIRLSHSRKHHWRAPIVGIICAAIVAVVLKSNPIYPIIAFTLGGAISIWIERPDLIQHSILGALSLCFVYGVLFFIFVLIFPNFIRDAYVLEETLRIIIWGVPVIELLYALSFGFLWTPLYEYEHGAKDVEI